VPEKQALESNRRKKKILARLPYQESTTIDQIKRLAAFVWFRYDLSLLVLVPEQNSNLMPTSTVASDRVDLKRALRLSDLILYGVILIQPTAPMSVFGVLSDHGKGHVVTTILVAMIAMLSLPSAMAAWPVSTQALVRRLLMWARPLILRSVTLSVGAWSWTI
jgi:hypothetical protein